MKKVCGLDVHKDSVFVCILSENGEKIQERFGVLTSELDCKRSVLRILRMLSAGFNFAIG